MLVFLQPTRKLESRDFILVSTMDRIIPSAEAILEKEKKERSLTVDIAVIAGFGDFCLRFKKYLEVKSSEPDYTARSTPKSDPDHS